MRNKKTAGEEKMQEKELGLLLIISGPSGVGKGTVCRILTERNDNMRMSVSATTRQKRPGEQEGVHYYFKTQEEFQSMIENNEFLEYMHVFGMNYYGTPVKMVEEQRRKGYDVILEIDVQGALRVHDVCPDAVLIFVAPPSLEELRKRLTGRGTEQPDVVEKRIATAFGEMRDMAKYDYVVVNDDLQKAVSAVENIVEAERHSIVRNRELIRNLMEGWNKQ